MAGDSEALWTEIQPYQHFIDIKVPSPELDAVLGWLNPPTARTS
jgi:hypothetical protein